MSIVFSHSEPGRFLRWAYGTTELTNACHANDINDDWWKLFNRTAGSGYQPDLTELSPGWGYWVKVDSNQLWTAPYLAP